MDRSPNDLFPESLPSLARPRAAMRALDRDGAEARYREAGAPFGDHVRGLGAWLQFAVGTTVN
jgi:hypothetical protein